MGPGLPSAVARVHGRLGQPARMVAQGKSTRQVLVREATQQPTRPPNLTLQGPPLRLRAGHATHWRDPGQEAGLAPLVALLNEMNSLVVVLVDVVLLSNQLPILVPRLVARAAPEGKPIEARGH